MIYYKDIKDIDTKELESLFKSVKWESGLFPSKLKNSIQNSYLVFSAWEDNSLVGLISCISEGSLCAYIPFLLVHPQKQNKGIGRKLIGLLLENIKNINKVILHSELSTTAFYKNNGFEEYSGAFPMHVISKCPKT